MRRQIFTRLLLVTFLFAAFSTASFAIEKETKYTTPVYLVLNSNQLQANKDLHITLQLNKTDGKNFTVNPIKIPSGDAVATEVRSESARDGKVDVDIIIRGSTFHPIFAGVIPEVVRVKILNIEFITVDNISGAYGTEPVTTNGPIAARLIDVNFENANGSAISIAQTQAMIEVAPTTSVSKRLPSDVSLFPNPVSDGNVSLGFTDDQLQVSLITVHNAVGAVVFQQRPAVGFSPKINLNIGNCNSGIYFVRLQTNNGEIVKKFNVIH